MHNIVSFGRFDVHGQSVTHASFPVDPAQHEQDCDYNLGLLGVPIFHWII